MAEYEVCSAKAGINTANSIMWQLKTAAGSRARIYEIQLSVASAPSNPLAWRLCRSATTGTSSATVVPEEVDLAGVAASSVLDTAWSVAATQASVSFRRYTHAQTGGSGIVWTWPDHRPLVVPVSSGILVVNDNAAGATLGTLNLTVVFAE
jgi:hypothetical protein